MTPFRAPNAEIITSAEKCLVDEALRCNPSELKILATRILELVAPEIAEAEDAKRLEREEQRARDNMRLSFKPLGNGTTRINGQLPDHTAERLKSYLHAFTNPRKADGALDSETDRIPYPKKLAQAFCSLLEHLDPAKLPQHAPFVLAAGPPRVRQHAPGQPRERERLEPDFSGPRHGREEQSFPAE